MTSKACWEQQRLEHSHLKDTPQPGVDQRTWDVERLATSYDPVRPSALMSGQGDSRRLGQLIPGVEPVHWWSLRADELPWLRRRTGVD